MNNTYIVFYSGANSQRIESAIKNYEGWFQVSQDAFIITSFKSTIIIRQQLELLINQGTDKLLVLKVKVFEKQGWLMNDEWDWLKNLP